VIYGQQAVKNLTTIEPILETKPICEGVAEVETKDIAHLAQWERTETNGE